MKIILSPTERWLHLVVSKETKERIQELAKLNKMPQAGVIEALVKGTQKEGGVN
jgi:hypothetical protein